MAISPEQTSVAIRDYNCVTPFGDAARTHAALLKGERSLKAVPVGGVVGGDLVPVSLMPGRTIDETVEPSWIPSLKQLLEKHGGNGWGTARRPIYFTGSNYGVGHLHAYMRSKNGRHFAVGSPQGCVERVCREMGWGENFSIFSHACVSAHLGLVQAERLVGAGLADEVLVVAFDYISPFVAGGFHALKILNSEFPSPYMDRATGSIGLGDGAAYAVIAKQETGFRILRQSLHNEMYHFTANRPDGTGFAACLGPLKEKAEGLRLWVKGHGTGTIDVGRIEAGRFAEFFPSAPLVGWKGSLGHTLGSCGLVELAVALESMKTGQTPGTVGTTAPTFTPNVALASFSNREYDGVLCASNAFGGAHAGLIVVHD